jgi:hypothetical protein
MDGMNDGRDDDPFDMDTPLSKSPEEQISHHEGMAQHYWTARVGHCQTTWRQIKHFGTQITVADIFVAIVLP